MRLAHPDQAAIALHEVLAEVAGETRVHPRPGGARGIDARRVHGPHHAIGYSALEREERRYVGRPGEVDQARGRAVMLHKGEPLEIIVPIRRTLQELMCLAFKDAQDALLLFRPCVLMHAEIMEVAGKAAVERPCLVALATKGPVGVRRLDYELEELVPA
jgi:hypothetical protein